MNTKLASFGLSLGLMAGIAFTNVTNANAQSAPRRIPAPQTENLQRLERVPLNPLDKGDAKAQLAPEWHNVEEILPPAQNGATINDAIAEEVFFNPKTKQEELRPTSPFNFRTRVQFGDNLELNGSNVGSDARLGDQDKNGEPKLDANGNLINSVIGTDQRVNITNTTVYPWRAVTKLFVSWPNGQGGGCSGTMISPRHVLTAGHCVFQSGKGGWANSIEVIPGLDGYYKPYGSAYASFYRSVTAWTVDANPEADYALITLDRNIGNTVGWFGYGNWSNLEGLTGNLAGYPGDLGGGREMYYDSDPIQDTNSNRLFYKIDTFNGQSGSGVYRIINGSRYVMGVHAYGDSGDGLNKATRINSSRFDRIQGWIDMDI